MTPEARRLRRKLDGWRASEFRTVDREERWCPNCRMRFRAGPPALEFPAQLSCDKTTFSYLLAAAREFDETAEELTPGECFTAVDFLDWIKPSLNLTGHSAKAQPWKEPAA